ncbi:DUF4214 domain-containing protein [Nocardioides sp. Kera G14]|uniref:DUF4214 domain-containing protein n=1 Tax=Nocardioides sp. Kera G14 TaxID=2884264 RepID=UPI001D12959D|nr:DUF4214 domain-containing protein [Nocardioides sp. Kera G14]UDY22674.1 DUF4214 domain-containing protein [Nocardioides sp. Kera G14]
MEEHQGSAPAGFAQIYEAVAQSVAERWQEEGINPRVPALEPAEVVSWSLFDVPRAALLGLDDDAVFVTALYTRLLNRLPAPREVRAWRRRLNEGLSRSDLLEEIHTSDEGQRMGAIVR